MMLKFTNCFKHRAGDPIYLNRNHIVAVYENHNEGGSLSTIIYGSRGNEWMVEEGLKEVIKIINESYEKSE